MADTIIDIETLLNDKTRNLIEELKKFHYIITVKRLEVGAVDYWSTNPVGAKDIQILAGINTNDKAGFTHEILHHIRETQGHYAPFHWLTTWVMLPDAPPDFYRTNDMFKSWIALVNNVAMHPKMLDDFKSYGFTEDQFLYDYHLKYESIDTFGYFNIVQGDYIDFLSLCQFIYFVCSVRFHPNKEVSEHHMNLYTKKYQDLNKNLHDPLNQICTDWLNGKIKNNGGFIRSLIATVETWRNGRGYYNFIMPPHA